MTRFLNATFSDQSVAIALRVLKRAELEAAKVEAKSIINPASEDRLWERKRLQWADLAVQPIEGTIVEHRDAGKSAATTILRVSEQDIENFNWHYVGEPNLERQRALAEVKQQVGNIFLRGLQNLFVFSSYFLWAFNRKK